MNSIQQMRKEQKSHRESQQEMAARCHHQKSNDKNEIHFQKKFLGQESQNLLCASGGKCAGICRELHLHRPRYAGVKAGVKDERGQAGRRQWAKRCPSAYEPPNTYRT